MSNPSISGAPVIVITPMPSMRRGIQIELPFDYAIPIQPGDDQDTDT
jgi:hypothetical protein